MISATRMRGVGRSGVAPTGSADYAGRSGWKPLPANVCREGKKQGIRCRIGQARKGSKTPFGSVSRNADNLHYVN